MRVINFFVVLFISILLFYSCINDEKTSDLPIFGNKTVVTNAFDEYDIGDTIYHHIPYFSLLNQDSILVDNSIYQGKILLVDFFFVNCPTICPIMTKNMRIINDKIVSLRYDSIQFLSLTVNPLNDKPSVLKQYSIDKKLNLSQWDLLTGNKDHLYDVAYNGFLANAMEDENAPGGFLHSSLFFLIDKEGRIRGIYDGVIDEDIDKCLTDLKKLYND